MISFYQQARQQQGQDDNDHRLFLFRQMIHVSNVTATPPHRNLPRHFRFAILDFSGRLLSSGVTSIINSKS
jgi:hypothetical protein